MDADAGSGEDPDLLLRKMGRSEVILAVVMTGLLIGGLASGGGVRWGLLIGCCLSGGLLLWSLTIWFVAYLTIHGTRLLGYLPPRKQ